MEATPSSATSVAPKASRWPLGRLPELSTRSLALWALVALIAVCLCWWALSSSPTPSTSGTGSQVATVTTNGESQTAIGEWQEVAQADFPVIIEEDGELLPVKVTVIGFLRDGKLAWIAPEGSRVKKGDRLMSLDSEELEDEIQGLQDELANYQRTLAQKNENLELEIKRLKAEEEAEEDRLKLAHMKEAEVLAKPTELERAEAQNVLQSAQARLTAAKEDLAAMRPLVAKGYANRTDLEAKELALKLAETERARAEQNAGMIMKGATPEDRQRAKMETMKAEIAFKQKKLDREIAIGKIEKEITSEKHRIERTTKRINDRESKMNESVKIAPHAGMVLHREIGWHSPKKPEIGDRVSRWSPPIELPSYDVMKVRTQIPESVVRKVIARRESQGQRLEKDEHGQEMIVKARKGRKGSPAKVRIKTLPDRVYNAEVIWIDGWARDRNDSLSDADIKKQGLSGVRVFNVEVELIESDPERLREGFRATVEFPIETVPDAITVPESAVHVEGGVAKVKVKASVGAVERIVTLGPKSQGRVVITEGLKAGEKILVPPAPVKQRRSDSERNEDSEDSAAEGGPDNTKSDEATQNAAPAEATPPAPAAQPDKPNAGKTGGSDAKGEKKRRTRGEGGPKRGGGGGGKRGPAK